MAYCLIGTKPGTEKDVARELRKDREIAELHGIFGEYDIIFKIEVENQKTLGDYIAKLNAKKDDRILEIKVLPPNFL